MTQTVTIPQAYGGSGITYRSDDGPYGFASQNGYGYVQYLFPMLTEVVAMGAHFAGRADAAETAADAAAASQAAADADAVATAADRVQTGLDAVATAADRVQTGLDRVATAADRVQTGLDAVATAADRVQTGLDRVQTVADAAATAADRVQTGLDRASATSSATTATDQATAATSFALTATAQASLALSYAASAASVAQQDLSGVTAVALHRSPNAVTAFCVYDTSKDSDGGAWVERCSHLSWANETLSGTWLGAHASEAAARAYGGTEGTEAITGADGTFASATGWTTGSGHSLGSGLLTLSSAAGGSATTTTGTASVVSTVYKVTVARSLTAGGIRVTYGGRTFDFYGTATDSIYLAATSAASTVSVAAIGTTTGSVDRVSIRPITANVTATGDYFRLITDGKDYSLNAGAGTTEVFRGNKPKFPSLAAIVCEAASLTIYDLTEPGRPMWMRFAGVGATQSTSGALGAVNIQNSGVFFHNGRLALSDSAASGGYCLRVINFPGDNAVAYRQTSLADIRFNGPLSLRQSGIGWQPMGSTYPSTNVTNGVATYTTPDAPVDSVTGLQVPNTVVSHVIGASVLRPDGTIVHMTIPSGGKSIAIGSRGVLVSRNASTGTVYFYRFDTIANAAAGATVSPTWTLTGLISFADPWGANLAHGNGVFAVASTAPASPEFTLLRTGSGANGATASGGIGLHATINASFNTGWMAGDFRRVWCADVGAGVVNTTPLLTGDDANFNGGTLGSWSAVYQCTASAASGAAVVTATGTNPYFQRILNGLRSGVRYRIDIDFSRVGTWSTTAMYVGNVSGLTPAQLLSTSIGPGAGQSFYFTADATGIANIQVMGSCLVGDTFTIDNVQVTPTGLADRSYKAKAATIYGTLTRTAVASAAQLVTYSGFSASNYIQEPYSADLDFGTGAWTCSAWVSIPTGIFKSATALLNYPVVGSEICTNQTFDSGTTGWGVVGGTMSNPSGRLRVDETGAAEGTLRFGFNTVSGKVYKVEFDAAAGGSAGSAFLASGSSRVGALAAVGGTHRVVYLRATITGANALFIGTDVGNGTGNIEIDNVSILEVGPAIIAQRAHSSGPSIAFGVDAYGYLSASANDGTTTRPVATTVAYNTGTYLKARSSYTADGTLSISVNGRIVASTAGTPLLTMSNASAVTTIGNSRTLDAPWHGSICLVKWGATVPTAEQALWMYEAEKEMFNAGAQVTLPDTGALVDVAYDDLYDRITAVSAANESNFTGLVRTSSAAVPAGAFTKVARGSGVKLTARSTTNIGVDVTIPSQNLKEELLRRSEAARAVKVPITFDYVGGFTANVSNGSTALSSVAGLSLPLGVNPRGVTVTGTGIPASTVITDVVGTTVYISKPATATNTGVSISMLEFPLPTGYEADTTKVAGVDKQEGATKDWTRAYDGFVEKVVYGAAPGPTAWVQARARRMA